MIKNKVLPYNLNRFLKVKTGSGCKVKLYVFTHKKPVSYTHLDVYKRQTYLNAFQGNLRNFLIVPCTIIHSIVLEDRTEIF